MEILVNLICLAKGKKLEYLGLGTLYIAAAP